MSPCQIQDAYRLPSQVAGTGRTVAIVDAYDNPNAESDLAVYRTQYGLPACTTANGCFKKLNQTGAASSYPTGDPGWGIEISLDLDAVSAACPLCHITLVEANSSSTLDLDVAEDTAAAQSPTSISNSWGGGRVRRREHPRRPLHPPRDPDHGVHRRRRLRHRLAGRLADGHGGGRYRAHAGLQHPRLERDGLVRSRERLLDARRRSPSGRPTRGCPSNRTIADVSALAGSPGLAIYDTYGTGGTWLDYGGTSLAAPLVGAVYALAYPDYTSAVTYTHAASLFDITSGSTGSCGGSYLCTGVTGFDGPTGLGTPCGTSAFGSGPYISTCPAPGSGAPAGAAPKSTAILTPACPTAAPGHVRCFAYKIGNG